MMIFRFKRFNDDLLKIPELKRQDFESYSVKPV
jgi:hypothetical protein